MTLLRWLRALRLSPENRNVHFLIAGSIGIGRVLNQLGEIKSINDFDDASRTICPASRYDIP